MQRLDDELELVRARAEAKQVLQAEDAHREGLEPAYFSAAV